MKNEARTADLAKPLNRFDMGKANLVDLGVTLPDIERIYRGLFVHSMGFIQMLREIGNSLDEPVDANKRGKKDFLQNNVWKVFQILLEYCSRTDYEMLLKKAEERHQVVLK